MAPGPNSSPRLRTASTGGTIPWGDVVQQGFMGISGINPQRRHLPTGVTYTLAARIKGERPAETPKDSTKDGAKKDADRRKPRPRPPSTPTKINVIAIADLDFIGEQFFELRRRKIEDLEFDNVPFVLNCVDVLAGDESFVGLRRKRPVHRRLELIEEQVKSFDKKLADQTRQADEQASEDLLQAQRALDKEVESVRNHTEWDERTKEIQLENLKRVTQRRFDVKNQMIEDKEAEWRSAKAKTESEQQIRRICNNVRYVAAGIPPLPPLDPRIDRLDRSTAPREPGRQPEAFGMRNSGWWLVASG